MSDYYTKYGTFSVAFLVDKGIKIFFAYPDEIIDFCIQTGRKITLDTSHLSMHCAYRGEDFIGSVKKLIPYTEHWHIGDALGS